VEETGIGRVPEPAPEPDPDWVKTAAQLLQKFAVSEFSMRQVGQRVAIVFLSSDLALRDRPPRILRA
jgi:hypothetical protein